MIVFCDYDENDVVNFPWRSKANKEARKKRAKERALKELEGKPKIKRERAKRTDAMTMIKMCVGKYQRGLLIKTKDGKAHPVMVDYKDSPITTQQILSFVRWQIENKRKIGLIQNYKIQKHIEDEITMYYSGNTGSKCMWSWCTIDIDVRKYGHKKGTTSGAIHFAEKIKKYIPGIVYELSTNGDGIHILLIIMVKGVFAWQYNNALNHFQRWLRQLAEKTNADIAGVEVKGHSPEWQLRYDNGKVVPIMDPEALWLYRIPNAVVECKKMGTMCRIPKQIEDRWEEYKNTPVISVKQLVEQFPLDEEKKIKKEKSYKPGSCNIVPDYAVEDLPLVTKMFEKMFEKVELRCGKKNDRLITPKSLAIAFTILKSLLRFPNQDNSCPQKRIQSVWNAGYKDFNSWDQAFDPSKYSAIVKILTHIKAIAWLDNRYVPPQRQFVKGKEVKIKGLAAKWELSQYIQDMFEKFKLTGQVDPINVTNILICINPTIDLNFGSKLKTNSDSKQKDSSNNPVKIEKIKKVKKIISPSEKVNWEIPLNWRNNTQPFMLRCVSRQTFLNKIPYPLAC